MITLSHIVPDHTPAMASMALEFVRAAHARDGAGELNKLLKRIKAERVDIRQLRDQVALPIPRLRSLSLQEIDALIDALLAAEERVSSLRALSSDVTGQTQVTAREEASGRSALLRRVATAADAMFVDFLVFLRDLRWDLMAYRADCEVHAGQSVIATTDQLRAFFQELETS